MLDTPGEGRPKTVTGDADIALGKAFNLGVIKLPDNTALDEEELGWLKCPCPLFLFYANRATGADRYAAAVAGQPLTKRVELAGSDLTDAGLEHLKTLPSLVELDVSATNVTRAGVESLQKALPNCKVLW